MKLSVIVPAYNEEEVLGPCLESIRRSLEVSPLRPDEYEILVVNNASTDATAEVARGYAEVVVIDEPRKGLTRAKQTGFEAARGALVAHPDADTLMPAEWISRALAEFERDPGLVALSGPYVYYDASAWSRLVAAVWLAMGFVYHLFIRDVLRRGAMAQGGNYIVRRRALEKAGGYDTTIDFYGEDFDIATRLSKVGKVKWTWKFPMYSSARRLAAEGSVMTGIRYGVNNIATSFGLRPMLTTHADIRPKQGDRAREALRRLIATGRL